MARKRTSQLGGLKDPNGRTSDLLPGLQKKSAQCLSGSYCSTTKLILMSTTKATLARRRRIQVDLSVKKKSFQIMHKMTRWILKRNMEGTKQTWQVKVTEITEEETMLKLLRGSSYSCNLCFPLLVIFLSSYLVIKYVKRSRKFFNNFLKGLPCVKIVHLKYGTA